jgi:hypothetical protein
MSPDSSRDETGFIPSTEALPMEDACATAQSGSLKDKLGEYWKQLKEAEHGKRFRRFYDLRQCSRDSQIARAISIGIGVALVAFGLAIGWLPGPGGFVAILGLAMLAQEFRPLASLLDWCERVIGSLWRNFRSLSLFGQSSIITALLAIGIGFAYLTYTAFYS